MLEKYDRGASKDVGKIYAYEPETKQQSTVWVFDEPIPTKIEVRFSYFFFIISIIL